MPYKVGTTQPTQYSSARKFGYSFSVKTAHGAPLITIIYATEDESKRAEDMVRIACARASGPSRYSVQNENGVKSSPSR